MHQPRKVEIRHVRSGVPGLDIVLGGGIPEYSFNLIAGAPGTGKTTLVHQIMFANATLERPALHFTVLGEPPVKMMRYQQQFDFFDVNRVGTEVHLLNLSEQVVQQDLDQVLEQITTEVERFNPSIVVVDSFRTVLRYTDSDRNSENALQLFIQRLALRLTGWEATTFLIGEYAEIETRNPVFTMADGIIWMTNEAERNTTVRKLRVTKQRGQGPLPGVHSIRISSRGVEVYPRLPAAAPLVRSRSKEPRPRLRTGVSDLDAMMNGGIPKGDSLIVGGPTGSGKTILATQFVAEGIRNGEKAVVAVFEEHPEAYVERAANLGFDLKAMEERGELAIMYLRPLDLSVDETLEELRRVVMRIGASRVVIDSLSGFEIALASPFRDDFRDSLYRLINSLTALDVTVLSTMEIADSGTSMQFTPHSVSFLSDDIIAQRYIELDGKLQKVMAIVKMRGSEHSRELRAYDVTSSGLMIGEALTGYRGIITGVPLPRDGDSSR